MFCALGAPFAAGLALSASLAGEVIEVAQPGKVEIGDRLVIMPNTLVVDARSVLLVTIFTV